MSTQAKPALEEQTVADLRALAKDAGISGFSHMHKDELISSLQSHNGSDGKNAPKNSHSPEKKIDAIALLKKDHATVDALFKEALSKDDGDTSMEAIAKQIISELEIHTTVEEKLFYPALKQKSLDEKNDEAKDEVLEAYVEHNSVKQLLAQISASKASDESYKALIQVASEQVKHHVEEEEQEMFKQAKKLLGQDELNVLGQKIVEMKEQLTAKA